MARVFEQQGENLQVDAEHDNHWEIKRENRPNKVLKEDINEIPFQQSRWKFLLQQKPGRGPFRKAGFQNSAFEFKLKVAKRFKI